MFQVDCELVSLCRKQSINYLLLHHSLSAVSSQPTLCLN